METPVEMEAIVERIKRQLSDFYDGNCWVTDNLGNKVLSINQEVALMKIQGFNHSVAELVGHITAWRNFFLQKLIGNDKYDIIDESKVNWPDAEDWNVIVEEFKLCHKDLLSAIEKFSIERWNTKVPLRNYSFIYLANGIVQHDYYHYGQIGSVLAAVKKLSNDI